MSIGNYGNRQEESYEKVKATYINYYLFINNYLFIVF